MSGKIYYQQEDDNTITRFDPDGSSSTVVDRYETDSDLLYNASTLTDWAADTGNESVTLSTTDRILDIDGIALFRDDNIDSANLNSNNIVFVNYTINMGSNGIIQTNELGTHVYFINCTFNIDPTSRNSSSSSAGYYLTTFRTPTGSSRVDGFDLGTGSNGRIRGAQTTKTNGYTCNFLGCDFNVDAQGVTTTENSSQDRVNIGVSDFQDCTIKSLRDQTVTGLRLFIYHQADTVVRNNTYDNSSDYTDFQVLIHDSTIPLEQPTFLGASLFAGRGSDVSTGNSIITSDYFNPAGGRLYAIQGKNQDNVPTSGYGILTDNPVTVIDTDATNELFYQNETADDTGRVTERFVWDPTFRDAVSTDPIQDIRIHGAGAQAFLVDGNEFSSTTSNLPDSWSGDWVTDNTGKATGTAQYDPKNGEDTDFVSGDKFIVPIVIMRRLSGSGSSTVANIQAREATFTYRSYDYITDADTWVGERVLNASNRNEDANRAAGNRDVDSAGISLSADTHITTGDSQADFDARFDGSATVTMNDLYAGAKWEHYLSTTDTDTMQVSGTTMTPDYDEVRLVNDPLSDSIAIAAPRITYNATSIEKGSSIDKFDGAELIVDGGTINCDFGSTATVTCNTATTAGADNIFNDCAFDSGCIVTPIDELTVDHYIGLNDCSGTVTINRHADSTGTLFIVRNGTTEANTTITRGTGVEFYTPATQVTVAEFDVSALPSDARASVWVGVDSTATPTNEFSSLDDELILSSGTYSGSDAVISTLADTDIIIGFVSSNHTNAYQTFHIPSNTATDDEDQVIYNYTIAAMVSVATDVVSNATLGDKAAYCRDDLAADDDITNVNTYLNSVGDTDIESGQVIIDIDNCVGRDKAQGNEVNQMLSEMKVRNNNYLNNVATLYNSDLTAPSASTEEITASSRVSREPIQFVGTTGVNIANAWNDLLFGDLGVGNNDAGESGVQTIKGAYATSDRSFTQYLNDINLSTDLPSLYMADGDAHVTTEQRQSLTVGEISAATQEDVRAETDPIYSGLRGAFDDVKGFARNPFNVGSDHFPGENN